MKRLFILLAIVSLVATSCYREPQADFTYSPGTPEAGETVYFTNLSMDAADVEWSFGDGYSATNWDVQHVYEASGIYNVQLKAYGKNGDLSVFITSVVVSDPSAPTADFWLSTDLPTLDGDLAVETDVIFIGEVITLNNESEGYNTLEWDLGNGYTLDEVSPQVTYDIPGTYTIILTANNYGVTDTYSKTFEVVEGVNSCVRITVLDFDYDYEPIADASVILYPTLTDWDERTNALEEVFTSALGKCVYEGLNEQRYYVDAYMNENFNNEGLGLEDAGWIETQVLEDDYIHDFFALIEYTGDGKKSVKMERVENVRVRSSAAMKKGVRTADMKQNKFSKTVKK